MNYTIESINSNMNNMFLVNISQHDNNIQRERKKYKITKNVIIYIMFCCILLINTIHGIF